MTRMKREHKEALIRDLRSGKYEQGRGALERIEEGGSKFCCLGIQCKQAFDASVITRKALPGVGNAHYAAGEGSYLPQKVVDWAGWELENEYNEEWSRNTATDRIKHGFIEKVPLYVIADAFDSTNRGTVDRSASAEDLMIFDGTTLAALNDAGMPFSKIADIVEKYVTAY